MGAASRPGLGYGNEDVKGAIERVLEGVLKVCLRSFAYDSAS